MCSVADELALSEMPEETQAIVKRLIQAAVDDYADEDDDFGMCFDCEDKDDMIAELRAEISALQRELTGLRKRKAR